MSRPLAIALAALCTAVGGVNAQSVRGMFVEFPSGHPIPDAEVRLWADTATLVATTRTDSTGTFVVAARDTGHYVVSVRKVGYMGGETKSLHIATADEYDIVIRSPRVAPTLSTVVVTAAGGGDRMWADGFRQRRESGFGAFLDANQIAERGATTVENMLRSLPGVAIQPAAFGHYLILSTRGGCRMALFVDGSPADGDMLATLVRPGDVEAVEVYSTAIDVPPIFRRATAGCGAVAIWTRSYAVRGR